MNFWEDEKNNRQSIRLPAYDYAWPGAYFVTIVTHRRICLFGTVKRGRVFLSDIGKIVEEAWQDIPEHYPRVSVDEYVIMPNHIHGIVNIHCAGVGAPYKAPVRNDEPNEISSTTLGVIIGTFKAAVTRKVHKLGKLQDMKIWLRNYYEHVIRDERDYERIVNYMASNPENWERDREHLTR